MKNLPQTFKTGFDKIQNIYIKDWRFSFVLLYAIMSLYVLAELKNNRFCMSDFSVYYKAATRVVHGENLFRAEEDGFYRFKYSPTSAVFFIPFSFLPKTAAQTAYWFFLSAMICIGLYISLRLINPCFPHTTNPKETNNLIMLTALIASVHVSRELELGQVNQLLFVLYVSGIYLVSQNKNILAGLLFAATVFLKPFALILIPWLFLRKKWKCGSAFLVFIAFFAFLPLLFENFRMLHSQYQGWFYEMIIELSHKQSLLAKENHTIFSILARYTPLRYTSIVVDHVKMFQGIVLCCIGAAFSFLMWKGKSVTAPMVAEAAILLCLIPLCTFTSHNAFGFSELAIMLLLFYSKSMPGWAKIVSITGMVFVGGNIYDLVGRKMWFILNDLSLVGIGAILLIIGVSTLRTKQIC